MLALAKMANGSMRDGLSLLDRLISTGIQPLSVNLLEDFLGRPNAEKVQSLIEKIGDGDAAGTLMATEDLVNTGLGEAQIVDALIEQMRDLLVVASAGVATDLLIMTAGQKERAAELSKKFDSAALIYNITALEKLRWAVKNSDTPRALLDASLLRFALSEHFINVDDLLARTSGGAPAVVKKKLPVASRPATPIVAVASKSADPQPAVVPVAPAEPVPGDLVESWSGILESVAKHLGAATTSLLTGSTPKGLSGDVLTIEFPSTGKMQKEMCESNGRSEQIAEALSGCLGRSVRVAFSVGEAPQSEQAGERVPFAERQRQILSDPGVKSILMGLGATVTGIEEE